MKLDNIINPIENSNYVVFYDKQDRNYEKLLMHTDDENTICIDLSTSEELSSSLKTHYKIATLPALLYENGVVYTSGDIEEQLSLIDHNHIKTTEEFIKNFVLEKGVTVFIKGTIENPYCKYTKELVRRLKALNIKNIKEFNIFTDKRLRKYLKNVNSWQTYPMIYVDNKFIGGLDAFINYVDNDGKFDELLNHTAEN